MQTILNWASLLLVVAFSDAAADAARVLRLGYLPNMTHAQARMARAGGEFEQKIGVPIQWTSFNAGPTAIEALFTDAVDASFVGPNPTINGYIKSKGEKFVIVAGSASGGAGLVVRRDAGIRTERDFHGKIIATPQLGNTQDVAARVWFRTHGYKLKERGGSLTLISMANPDQLTMLQKKEIHGAWTVEPWLSRIELEGGGILYLDEKTLWPQEQHVTTHLVVSKAFLAGNPDLIKNLLRALVEVTQRINADKAAAARVVNAELKKVTGKALAEAVIDRAMGRVEFTWDPIRSSLYGAAEAAREIGFLRSTANLQGIHSLRILNQVLEEKGLPLIAP